MKPLLIASLLLATLHAQAQHTTKSAANKNATPTPAAKPADDDDDTTGNWMVRGDPDKFFSSTFTYVDKMPVCPYGIGEYLGANLHYPDSARVHNKEGKVVIKFIVDHVGKIRDAKVLKGFDSSCDAEALRVVSGMPPWKPGSQQGKPVMVYFTLPINFKLTD